MAGASLLALIDDIATLLDDVSVMTKVAAKKTAGVLGDDLALNAQQVTGVNADRELPVVWAVAKGSMLNKAILVPLALVLSAWLAWSIPILLVIGGTYLCFEGFEKIYHKIFHQQEEVEHQQQLAAAINDEKVDLLQFEKEKIKGAIRTDFVLSAEIIVISLGVVAGETLSKQIITLSAIAILMTVGVYGFVALIVKLDDFGWWLQKSRHIIKQKIGQFCLWLMPKLMHALAFFGTLAMFLVGGSIVIHNLPHSLGLHHIYQMIDTYSAKSIITLIFDAVGGIIIGAITLLLISIATKLKNLVKSQ